LENRRGKDDEVSGKVWKTMETEVGKTGIAKTKR